MLHGLKEHFVAHRALPRKLAAVTVEAMCETAEPRQPGYPRRAPRSTWHADIAYRLAYLGRGGAGDAEDDRAHGRAVHPDGDRAPGARGRVRDGAMFPPTLRDVAHPAGRSGWRMTPRRGLLTRSVKSTTWTTVHRRELRLPTAGQSNPTQMIVALALRLADLLKDRASVVTQTGREVGAANPGDITADVNCRCRTRP